MPSEREKDFLRWAAVLAPMVAVLGVGIQIGISNHTQAEHERRIATIEIRMIELHTTANENRVRLARIEDKQVVISEQVAELRMMLLQRGYRNGRNGAQ